MSPSQEPSAPHSRASRLGTAIILERCGYRRHQRHHGEGPWQVWKVLNVALRSLSSQKSRRFEAASPSTLLAVPFAQASPLVPLPASRPLALLWPSQCLLRDRLNSMPPPGCLPGPLLRHFIEYHVTSRSQSPIQGKKKKNLSKGCAGWASIGSLVSLSPFFVFYCLFYTYSRPCPLPNNQDRYMNRCKAVLLCADSLAVQSEWQSLTSPDNGRK